MASFVYSHNKTLAENALKKNTHITPPREITDTATKSHAARHRETMCPQRELSRTQKPQRHC